MNKESCASCKFLVPDAQGDLRCRRNPPTLQYLVTFGMGKAKQPDGSTVRILKPGQVNELANFPVVRPEWWCGEWRTKLLQS